MGQAIDHIRFLEGATWRLTGLKGGTYQTMAGSEILGVQRQGQAPSI